MTTRISEPAVRMHNISASCGPAWQDALLFYCCYSVVKNILLTRRKAPVMEIHRLLYNRYDGGRATHATAMKRMTNIQALVNCIVAMKRVPSKLEVLLGYACAGKRNCWIQGTETGRLLRMVARFHITLDEVIIQVSKHAERRTSRPVRVVCRARA